MLKDPAKPKAKGNYWTVDVSRIPPEALKLQNTAVARGGAAAFARDLAPFVLRGYPYSPPTPKSPPEPSGASRPASGFSIASLLREFPQRGNGGEPSKKSGTPPEISGDPVPVASWGSAPVFHLAAAPPPVTPWVPPVAGGRSGGSDPEGGSRAPPPVWGQLPTSYSTAVAPNAVAPPSGPPFLALRWGVLPPGPPPPGPPLGAEAEAGGAQAMPPPNKSIFDIWLSHPGDVVRPTLHG